MKIVLGIITLVLLGCEGSHSKLSGDTWVYSADPQQQFELAIEKQDYRFMGIYGYSLTVPHVHKKCLSDIEKEVNPIEGTSDAFDSYEQAKFNSVARVYADYFNIKMLEYRRINQGFRCGS